MTDARSAAVAAKRALRRVVPLEARIWVRRGPALVAWALERRTPSHAEAADFPFVSAARSSPLRRPGTTYDPVVQRGKETNVRAAARRLHGVVIPAHETLSWHRVVGPPLRIRGFVPGPELRADAMAMGVGGGACQVANLLFFLAVHGGLSIVERHRHGLDLFPDDQRDVPFGCGATVFFPTRDLVVANPGPDAVQLSFEVHDGVLQGALRRPRDDGRRRRIVEEQHRFVRRPDGVYRENELWLETSQDGAPPTRRRLLENCARVRYSVPEADILSPEEAP